MTEPVSRPLGDDENRSALDGVARSTVVLTATAALGQVFTLIRELYIAYQVGTSLGLDALLVAAVIPQMAASLLASGTGAAVIPGYLEAKQREGQAAADRLFSAVLTWALVGGIPLSLLILAFPMVIITISGPGLPPGSQEAAAGYLPILAPMLVLSALGGLMSALFQAHNRLGGIAVAWAAGPIASLVTMVALWGPLGLTAVAIAMTVQQGVVLLVLLVLALRRGWLTRPTLSAPRGDMVAFARHAGPLTLSSAVLQFNLLTDRAVASLLGAGAVSALRYAEGVIRLPLNAIGPAWSAAIYPALVRASNDEDGQPMGRAASDAMRYITAIFVPLSVATMALAPLIVAVVYVRGAFSQDDAQMTALVLVGFAPLLFLNMANTILTGGHNARRRGMFLMWMGITNAILNALFNIGFGLLFGVAGVALSTSVTVGIVQAVKARQLAVVDPAFPIGEVSRALALSVAASLAIAIPVGVIAWQVPLDMGTLPSLALLVVLTLVGIAGYVGVARALRFDEPLTVLRAIVDARPARLRRT